MLRVAFKLTVLLAVLCQYSPVRSCAIEASLTDSNCHQRAFHGHADLGRGHTVAEFVPSDAFSERPGSPETCVCEKPKLVSDKAAAPQQAPCAFSPALARFGSRLSCSLNSDASHRSGYRPPPEVGGCLPLLI